MKKYLILAALLLSNCITHNEKPGNSIVIHKQGHWASLSPCILAWKDIGREAGLYGDTIIFFHGAAENGSEVMFNREEYYAISVGDSIPGCCAVAR